MSLLVNCVCSGYCHLFVSSWETQWARPLRRWMCQTCAKCWDFLTVTCHLTVWSWCPSLGDNPPLGFRDTGWGGKAWNSWICLRCDTLCQPVLAALASRCMFCTDRRQEAGCQLAVVVVCPIENCLHWYHISQPIRHTFFPEKCDLSLTWVLCAEGKCYFQTYKYPCICYTTSLSWDSENNLEDDFSGSDNDLLGFNDE